MLLDCKQYIIPGSARDLVPVSLVRNLRDGLHEEENEDHKVTMLHSIDSLYSRKTAGLFLTREKSGVPRENSWVSLTETSSKYNDRELGSRDDQNGCPTPQRVG